MPAPASFEYAIIRVMPRVERGEFLNAGIIVYSKGLGYLKARVELHRECLAAMAPDVDPDDVWEHLCCIPKLCEGTKDSGPLGKLSRSERFNWLVAPRSTVVQTSPVHAGLTADPDATLNHLMKTLVQRPERSGAGGPPEPGAP